METNSQTPEYIEAEKYCDRYAKKLADQLLNRLNTAFFDENIKNAIKYPRQLILEKIVKLLTDQI